MHAIDTWRANDKRHIKFARDSRDRQSESTHVLMSCVMLDAVRIDT